MTPGNLSTVTSLALLRERAKSVRASYKRHWEALNNIKPQKFDWESPEGDADAVSRQDNLLRYIEDHLPLVDIYGRQIRSRNFASRRWAVASCNGGTCHRAWVALNAAIEEELRRRENGFEYPVADTGNNGAQVNEVPSFPLQYAIDNKLIEREMQAEYLGVKKPTVKDKLKAAITPAYETNNLEKEKRFQDQLEEKLAHERIERRPKKLGKRMIKQLRQQLNYNSRPSDPNSDNDS